MSDIFVDLTPEKLTGILRASFRSIVFESDDWDALARYILGLLRLVKHTNATEISRLTAEVERLQAKLDTVRKVAIQWSPVVDSKDILRTLDGEP